MGRLGRWAALGLDPATFWQQTPRSYAAIIKAREEAEQHRFELAHDLHTMTAWKSVNYSRMDRMPALKQELWQRPQAKRTRQSSADMIMAMRAWVGASRVATPSNTSGSQERL